MWRDSNHHATTLKCKSMENLSKAIVVLIRKCLKENYKGIIEFSIGDFNEIGFSSSQPLAVLMDDETKSIANDYGFDYVDFLSNPGMLVFINRIENISNTKVQRYRMYSYVYVDNKLICRDIEIPNDDILLSKRIAFVMQNREKLLQE